MNHFILVFTTLRTNSAEDFDITFKFSPTETFCMQCPSLFTGKSIYEKYSEMLAADCFLSSMLRVKIKTRLSKWCQKDSRYDGLYC